MTVIRALSVTLGLSGATVSPSAAAQPLRVGAARMDIAPRDLVRLDPFGGGGFKSVHDPIYARPIWLESGGEQGTNLNDRIGYIADDDAYDHPNFEGKGSPFARGCAEQAIIARLTGMIRYEERKR